MSGKTAPTMETQIWLSSMTEVEKSVRDFLLLDEIGNGGMGTIHRAVHGPSGLPVALKLLHPHLAKDESFVTRFEREASTVAQLRHENVVSIVEHGKVDGENGPRAYIAFELVDGCDLESVLATVERLGAAAAVSIACDVLRGLAHAHDHGVIHRDVKPGNVLLGRTGAAKIADFSIAHDGRAASLTLTGAVLGTPGYMSPEQLEACTLDGRTDVFSTGVMLYQMLGGRRPFEGEGFVEVMREVLSSTPPDLCSLDATIPASLARVVRIALEKDPATRFASAAEFERALAKAAAESGIEPSRDAVASLLMSAPMQRRLLSIPSPATMRAAVVARIREDQKKVRGARLQAFPVALAVAGFAVVLGTLAVTRSRDASAIASTGTGAPAPLAAPTAPSAIDAHGPPVEAWLAARPARTAPRRVIDPDARIVDPESRRTGLVKLTVKPWAEVFVDDRFVATTPFAPLELDPGSYRIRYVHPEYGSRTERVVVVAGHTTERMLDFRIQ